MRIPPRQVQALTEFAREIAKCECGAVLDFDTDLNGYVVESCVKCHFKRAMRPVRPRFEIDPMPLLSDKPLQAPTGTCKECGATVRRAGSTMPDRCKPCAKERAKEQQRRWSAERRRRAREAA